MAYAQIHPCVIFCPSSFAHNHNDRKPSVYWSRDNSHRQRGLEYRKRSSIPNRITIDLKGSCSACAIPQKYTIWNLPSLLNTAAKLNCFSLIIWVHRHRHHMCFGLFAAIAQASCVFALVVNFTFYRHFYSLQLITAKNEFLMKYFCLVF